MTGYVVTELKENIISKFNDISKDETYKFIDSYSHGFLKEFFKKREAKKDYLENLRLMINNDKFGKYRLGNIQYNLYGKDNLPEPRPPDKRINTKQILKLYNTKQYTAEEQLQFMDQLEKQIKDPFKQQKIDLPVIVDGYEVPLKDIVLNKHQTDFCKKLMFNDTRGAIAFHGVGTGKTLTAILTSKLWLLINNNDPEYKVFVITPNATLNGFTREMIEYGADPRDNRYRFFTFDSYYREKPLANEKTMIVVDEAHNFRTEISTREDDDNIIVTSNKKGYILLENGAKRCGKIVLLTGTPFVNRTYDIENLISMVDGKTPLKPSDFGTIETTVKSRHDYFRFRISHFEREQTSEFYPERDEKLVAIVMTQKDIDERSKILNNENRFRKFFNITEKLNKDGDKGLDIELYMKAFWNGERQMSDKLGHLKIDYLIDLITKNKNDKFAIYITYTSALNILKNKLKELEIDCGVVSGAQSKNVKTSYINSYNQDVIRVLLFTKAGMEGVDLKGTNWMIMYDEVWNDASTEQAIARAIRYKSHYHLPKKDQVVKVRKLIVCNEKEKKFIDAINRGEFEGQYKLLGNTFKEAINPNIEEKRIYKETLKDYKNTPNALELLKKRRSLVRQKPKPIKEIAELDKLIQSDRHRIAKQKLQLSELKFFIDGEEFSLKGTTPNIDLYMFIITKAKQSAINEFIIDLDKIPQLEDIKTKKEESFYTDLLKINNKTDESLNLKEKLELYRKHFKSSINKTINLLDGLQDDTILEQNKNVDGLLMAIHEKNVKKAAKNAIKLNQEFFTEEHVAVKLYNMSSLPSKVSKITLLEPSAGHLGLIIPIMKAKKHIDYHLVEIKKDNREVIQKIIKDANYGDGLKLMEQGNFLKFFPPLSYDYIFTNPPFHLRKSDFPEYKRDVWDMDFIIRAYNMLKDGGELLGIIGHHYKKDKKYMDWLKEHNAIIQEEAGKWEGIKDKSAEIKCLQYSLIKIIKKKNDKYDYENLFVDTPVKSKHLIIEKEPPVEVRRLPPELKKKQTVTFKVSELDLL